MISIFTYDNYRKFLRDSFSQRLSKGRGQRRKWAEFLGVHTTLVSQILSGSRELSTDHAALTGEFLGLAPLETDYFVGLVRLERAGNSAARALVTRELARVKTEARKLENRLPFQQALTEEEKALFYSDWTYAAIRQLSAIPLFQTPEAMAEALRLPLARVKLAAAFLVRAGLCREERGRLVIGAASTHVGGDSPWVRSHHRNWREKAAQSLDHERASDLHYTAPLTLAAKDAGKVRELLVQALQGVNQVVDPSPSEAFYCLSLDWFQVAR